LVVRTKGDWTRIAVDNLRKSTKGSAYQQLAESAAEVYLATESSQGADPSVISNLLKEHILCMD